MFLLGFNKMLSKLYRKYVAPYIDVLFLCELVTLYQLYEIETQVFVLYYVGSLLLRKYGHTMIIHKPYARTANRSTDVK
jgi:hypothetical protein